MPCGVCGAADGAFGSGRSICVGCHERVKPIIALINSIDYSDNTSGNVNGSTSESNSPFSSNSSRGLANALRRVREIKEKMSEMKETLSYLNGFGDAFSSQIHTDIQVKPGDNGPSIPAHRALLATRSIIFKNMFDSDECIKAPDPNDETITLAELSYDELDSLLEFLYKGELPKEKLRSHARALLIAADKYDIPFLRIYSERQLLGSLGASNAVDVLEISISCPGVQNLTSGAMGFIVKNMKDIVFTDRYEAFAVKNPHLALQITRGFLSGQSSGGISRPDPHNRPFSVA